MKRINLPENLNHALQIMDEEDGGIVIDSLIHNGLELEIFFRIVYFHSELPTQLWKVSIPEIKKEHFLNRNVSESTFAIYSEHPLLIELKDGWVELYYKGKTANAEKLFIDLYKLFERSYWKSLGFGFKINAPEGMLNLCAYEAGLFARGPKSILFEYAACLNENNIQTSLIGEYEAWNDDLKVLVIGESYFISEEFKFEFIESIDS